MSVLKVETDINISNSISPIKQTLFFYRSHHDVLTVTLIDNLKYQSQFVDTKNILLWDQEKMSKFQIKAYILNEFIDFRKSAGRQYGYWSYQLYLFTNNLYGYSYIR